MRVKVYRNLARNCYSVVNCATGKVIAWTSRILLQDCKFVVQRGGRDRMLREKKRNIHAFIVGDWDEEEASNRRYAGVRVKYNPYKDRQFILQNGQPVLTAKSVFLNEAGVLSQI